MTVTRTTSAPERTARQAFAEHESAILDALQAIRLRMARIHDLTETKVDWAWVGSMSKWNDDLQEILDGMTEVTR